jgi:imidazole glycerol-phosphate synthase subunit HisH
MSSIAIIDYGMGNLRSVSKALEHVASGDEIRITSDVNVIRDADRVVFPGVGAMPDCMRALSGRGLVDAVRGAAADRPFLGICLGLQALFQHSEEGDCQGLAILPGRVHLFPGAAMRDERGERLKVPHIGWNTVHQTREHPLWATIEDGARFYFVHSYYAEPTDPALAVGTSRYPFEFTCACARGNLFAVQFHPEKSQAAGLRLLANFVRWDGRA